MPTLKPKKPRTITRSAAAQAKNRKLKAAKAARSIAPAPRKPIEPMKGRATRAKRAAPKLDARELLPPALTMLLEMAGAIPTAPIRKAARAAPTEAQKEAFRNFAGVRVAGPRRRPAKAATSRRRAAPKKK